MIDLISLKPFDMETISNSVRKTRKAIIVEECMKTGGIGASLSAVINETLFDELDHQARPPPSMYLEPSLGQATLYCVRLVRSVPVMCCISV